MANPEHLEILKQGVGVWNAWRKEHPYVRPDLEGVDLSVRQLDGINLFNTNLSETNFANASLKKANLTLANLNHANLHRIHLSDAYLGSSSLVEADLTSSICKSAYFHKADLAAASLQQAYLFSANLEDTNLEGANLQEATLNRANFEHAQLEGANLTKADLSGAKLINARLHRARLKECKLLNADFSYAKLMGADLRRADLEAANLWHSHLNKANLEGAELDRASLVETVVEDAILNNCYVYGISVWNVVGTPREQNNLRVSQFSEPTITVDNLEVAQFIYLLRENKKVREVLTTITSKAVLLLGRFGQRKYVLEAIADVLRKEGYITIIFDFKEPDNRDLIDTVKTLALLSKFVIIDLTDPRSTPYELSQIASLMVPIQPLLQAPETEPAFLEPLRRRNHWLLNTHCYQDVDSLCKSLENKLLEIVEAKAAELKARE